MQLTDRYDQFLESELRGRYITISQLRPLLDRYKKRYNESIIGRSENGIEIPMLTIGKGKKKVLAWSQMHGNESTTTKAIFDFLSFISQSVHCQDKIEKFIDEYTLSIIPILNPDGAKAYTRENANGVDLNRDAQDLSQSESKALRTVFESLQPDMCLNLHDQRTIYGVKGGKPATVSFLAPAADIKRTKTAARKEAMKCIENMASVLHAHIPGQVGRYDDSYNINCVGDTFQNAGVPTILFEAGHFPGDYEREKSRKYIWIALLALFGFVTQQTPKVKYTSISENNKKFRDVILRNVRISDRKKPVSIAIQFKEDLGEDGIRFVPVVDEIGKLTSLQGHKEIDGQGNIILMNSQEIINVGDEVLEIVTKNNNSLLYSSI